MVLLADHVASFLEKNRMYEVLGLFVLLLVGFMLTAEGAHIAHLDFFGFEIHPMEKAPSISWLAALVVVDVLQGRYQKKLDVQESQRRARSTSLLIAVTPLNPAQLNRFRGIFHSMARQFIYSHARPFQVLCRRQEGSRQCASVVLPRCQDRRAGP